MKHNNRDLIAKIIAILFIVAIYIFTLGLSWFITCIIIKLITLCFGWGFSWGIATGIWLIMLLLMGIFKGSKS